MDENERADMAEALEDKLHEMAEDEELRAELKVQISKARQERLIDAGDETQADVEARNAAIREAELEEQRIIKGLKLGKLDEDDEDETDEGRDEEEQYEAMTQEERDKINPYMEDGMNEEQKEDARLEMEVDRTIFSEQVRGAVLTDMELTLLDYDRDDEQIEEMGLELDDDILTDADVDEESGDADVDEESEEEQTTTAMLTPTDEAQPRNRHSRLSRSRQWPDACRTRCSNERVWRSYSRTIDGKRSSERSGSSSRQLTFV